MEVFSSPSEKGDDLEDESDIPEEDDKTVKSIRCSISMKTSFKQHPRINLTELTNYRGYTQRVKIDNFIPCLFIRSV
jgi:hypothetical protein